MSFKKRRYSNRIVTSQVMAALAESKDPSQQLEEIRVHWNIEPTRFHGALKTLFHSLRRLGRLEVVVKAEALGLT